MTKGQMLASVKHMSAEEQKNFDRWIKGNVVIASILAAGLVAMALAGAGADADIGPRSARAEVQPLANPPSPYELMLRLAPDALPVQEVDEPF